MKITEEDICDNGGYLLSPRFVVEKINKLFNELEMEIARLKRDLTIATEELLGEE